MHPHAWKDAISVVLRIGRLRSFLQIIFPVLHPEHGRFGSNGQLHVCCFVDQACFFCLCACVDSSSQAKNSIYKHDGWLSCTCNVHCMFTSWECLFRGPPQKKNKWFSALPLKPQTRVPSTKRQTHISYQTALRKCR